MMMSCLVGKGASLGSGGMAKILGLGGSTARGALQNQSEGEGSYAGRGSK